MSILKSVSLLKFFATALASAKRKENTLEDKWNQTFRTQQMNVLQYLVLNVTNIASLISIFDNKAISKDSSSIHVYGNGLHTQMIAIRNCNYTRHDDHYAQSFRERRERFT